jgi:hypothetical protein
MARTQAVSGAHSALAGAVIACPAGKGRRLVQVPRVRNVVAASEAATLTTFVAFKADAPMRLVVGREGATVANLFTILTSEAKFVLGGIIEIPMAIDAWPLPLSSLREELDHNVEAGFVSHIEGRVSALSRFGPYPNDQQKAEKDCRQKLTQGSLL